jgi:hypothetical protein
MYPRDEPLNAPPAPALQFPSFYAGDYFNQSPPIQNVWYGITNQLTAGILHSIAIRHVATGGAAKNIEVRVVTDDFAQTLALAPASNVINHIYHDGFGGLAAIAATVASFGMRYTSVGYHTLRTLIRMTSVPDPLGQTLEMLTTMSRFGVP